MVLFHEQSKTYLDNYTYTGESLGKTAGSGWKIFRGHPWTLVKSMFATVLCRWLQQASGAKRIVSCFKKQTKTTMVARFLLPSGNLT